MSKDLKVALVISSPLKADTVSKLKSFSKGIDFEVKYLSSEKSRYFSCRY